MLAVIKQLVKDHSICVLATSRDDRPHCSLMAYAANDEATEIYLVTLTTTRKYANLTANPAVSLLIDSRGEADRARVQALTVEGSCAPIADADRRERARQRLVAAHPHLGELLAHPDGAILGVTVTAFLLLNGLTEAHHLTLA